MLAAVSCPALAHDHADLNLWGKGMVALAVIEAMRSRRRLWPEGGQIHDPTPWTIGARSRTELLTAWGQEPKNVVRIFMTAIT